MTQRPSQLAFIDFLRGAAALIVAVFHLVLHQVLNYPRQPLEPHTLAQQLLQGWFDPGKFGVAMFFVISGFLIPATLRAPTATIGSFVVRRAFRLYPLYWLSLLTLLVANRFSAELFPSLGPVTAQRVAANALMVQGFVGQKDLIGVYWTLQIELVFYLTCGVLLALRALGRSERMLYLWLGGALLCAAVRLASGSALPVALFLGLTLMFLGDLLREHHEGRAAPGALRRTTVVVALVIVPVCWMSYRHWQGYVAAYWAAILVVFAAHAFWERFERRRALRTLSESLGNISYGVYLFHPLIAMPLGQVLLRKGVSVPATLLLALGATVAAAWVLHHAVERPCVELGRLVSTRFRPPPVAAAAHGAVQG